MVTIAVVGAGSFAKQHLQAYAVIPQAQVNWLCDPREEDRDVYAQTYDIPRVTNDYQRALDDEHVDLVDIVAPNYLHRPIAVAAMEAGKDVVCEKPMALNVEESTEMVDAARRTGRQLHVKYHQRFEPLHRQVKSMWDEGDLADAAVTIARRMDNHLPSMLDSGHWRGVPALTGGGCLFSSGSHTLDVLNYFFGPAKAVTATNRRLVADDPDKADDNATVVIEFDGGMMATFVGCWTVRHVKWATTEIYSPDSTLRVRTDNGALVLEREHARGVDPLAHSEDWFRTSNIEALRHFVSCVDGGEEPLYSPADCVASMRTLEAAYHSSQAGRRVELTA